MYHFVLHEHKYQLDLELAYYLLCIISGSQVCGWNHCMVVDHDMY